MGTKLKIILSVSLGINLLLTGMLAGYFSRGCKRQSRHFRPPHEMTQKLSPEHAKLFSEAMEQLHKNNRKDSEKIREVRQEVKGILSAPKFNAQAFQEKMQELHQLHGQMKDQLVQTVTNLASQLDPSERQALAAMLQRGPLGDRPGGRLPRGPGHDEFRRHRPPPGGSAFDPPDRRGPPPPETEVQ